MGVLTADKGGLLTRRPTQECGAYRLLAIESQQQSLPNAASLRYERNVTLINPYKETRHGL